MKIAFTFLLLFTYASIMLKPLMPFISDALEHTLNYSSHMATVHQHNGKFHVHNEFVEASKKNTDNKTDLQKKNSSDNEHLFSFQETSPAVKYLSTTSFKSYNAVVISADPCSDFPPPRQ